MQNFMVVEGGGEIKKLGGGVKIEMIEEKRGENCIKNKVNCGKITLFSGYKCFTQPAAAMYAGVNQTLCRVLNLCIYFFNNGLFDIGQTNFKIHL